MSAQGQPDQHNVFFDPFREIYEEAHDAWWEEHEHPPFFYGAPCAACDALAAAPLISQREDSE